jgi:putative oxidoreductase
MNLILRVILGALFFGHGTQKLFGWFGGYGLDGTAGFLESIGLRPGRRQATIAGVAEAGGGALLVAGLATPVAAASITGVMTTAMRTVHLPNGPWITENGYEYTLVNIAAAAAIVDSGAGPLSLDRALGIELKGPFWALVAVAAGVAGAELNLRQCQQQDEGAAPQAAPQTAGDPASAGATT